MAFSPALKGNCMNICVNTPEELKSMPDEYRDILAHQVLAHTSGELSGGDHYILGARYAPNAFEIKVCYEAAAQEINHYMLGAQILADMGIDTSHMLRQSLEQREHYPSDFVHEHSNWAERGLTSMLAEAAALEHIVEMQESSYKPLARSLDIVVTEESQHIAHGYRIVKAFCETDAGRAQVQQVLNRKWGQVLDLFGSSTSKRSELFLKWGLRQRSNEQARRDFIAKKRPKLAELGLTAPDDHLNRKFM
jgi:ring-1,2-phenylacetyl-CoA epoxidase subunit PaaA